MGRKDGDSLVHLPKSRDSHLLPIALRYQEQWSENLQQIVTNVPGMSKSCKNQPQRVSEFRSQVTDAFQNLSMSAYLLNDPAGKVVEELGVRNKLVHNDLWLGHRLGSHILYQSAWVRVPLPL